MSRERKGWAHRLQPVVGALILALGLSVFGLLVRRGLDKDSLGTAGMTGMMAMGGLSLLFRSPISRATAGLFALGAAVIAGAVVAAVALG